MKTLRVETCNHTLKIYDNKLVVGCQEILGEDALKILEFLQENKKDLNKSRIKLGVWYITIQGDRMFVKIDQDYSAIDRDGCSKSYTYKELDELISVYGYLTEVE